VYDAAARRVNHFGCIEIALCKRTMSSGELTLALPGGKIFSSTKIVYKKTPLG
jgi:hypothetical protein